MEDLYSEFPSSRSGALCAPFTPVTFWHVIVADYMTSLAKAAAAPVAEAESNEARGERLFRHLQRVSTGGRAYA